jgi:hypothetical protein
MTDVEEQAASIFHPARSASRGCRLPADAVFPVLSGAVEREPGVSASPAPPMFQELWVLRFGA